MKLWSEFPTWCFCRLDGDTVKYVVKVTPSVEAPFVGTKQRDGPLTIRTLINSTQKLVGYSFAFRNKPKIREFGYSLAASYGLLDSDSILLVLGSPQVRVIRTGTEHPAYQIVLRHK